MAVWTAPTTRSTGALVSASIWNTDIVENLKYLKDSPVFDGDISVGDDLLFTSSGAVINFNSDATITHSTNTLTFAGASSGYIFNDGNVGIGVTPTSSLHVERASTDNIISAIGQTGYEGVVYLSGAGSGKDTAVVIGNGRSLNFKTTATATPTASGTTRMTLTDSGNVGIGTTSPGSRLDVQTTAQSVANIVSSNAAGGYLNLGRSGANAIIGSYNAASGGGSTINADALFLRNANGIGFGSGGAGVTAHLTSGGNFAIGATAKLYLDGVAGTGDTYISEGAANQIYVTTAGSTSQVFDQTGIATTMGTSASAANVFYDTGDSYLKRSTSSLRYKHDIATLDTAEALDAVMHLRPVTYRGKTDEDQRRFVGFIAEEVQAWAPLLCTYDDGGESGTPNYVTYDRVTAYLVAVVQQQQAEIDALKARID